MACYYPLKGYRARSVNPKTGKRSIVFDSSLGFMDMPVEFACGQCIGCRIERSRQWAIRCVHEAQLHEDNCFITLTYAPEHLPKNGSLVLEHFQDFMKRFRKQFVPKCPISDSLSKTDDVLLDFRKAWFEAYAIRFFHCGEYGENLGRPHYHAIVFGYDFPDRKFLKSKAGCNLYTSEILQELWPFGFCTVGNVTFESAAYVARYVMKKVSGELSELWYEGRKPEYITMSRRPGIASDWFKQFEKDVFPCDEVVLRGKKLTVPKYYDKLLEIDRVAEFQKIKAKRKAKALLRKDDNTIDRLRVREICARAKLGTLIRELEHE